MYKIICVHILRFHLALFLKRIRKGIFVRFNKFF